MSNVQKERRRPPAAQDAAQLKSGLTPEQLSTLLTMEQFGWRLRFVRRPLFQPPVPVLFDRDGTRYVVIEADGTINERPALKLRG
ncbi:MAG TPA: hypothetical protein VFF91_02305 [Pseudoxanthomonas sp.]|nr:hypothetical protein [Pseudoxanthomonas sp.]